MACGDSITVYIYLNDSLKQGDWWQVARANGIADSHWGITGSQVSTTLRDDCPLTTVYSTAPYIIALNGGVNDFDNGVPVGAIGTPGTFLGDYELMISSTWLNGANPTKMVSRGILPNIFSGTQAQKDAWNLHISSAVNFWNAANPSKPVCYIDPRGWLTTTNDLQPDGLHPNTTGFAEIANNEITISAGYFNGASFTSTGPIAGFSGVASTNFTVQTATGSLFTGTATSTQTITLNDGSAGGTFITSLGTSGTGPLDKYSDGWNL